MAYIILPDDENMLGKKIRAIVSTVDGETVYSDVVALTDSKGQLIDLFTAFEQILVELRKINLQLSFITQEEISDKDVKD